ncbi:YheC/YheD family endospore coat-associated protein [Brevibacillus daliensis]|uniref:YheC/YheD family endospore coat-associated protein n=1 Tax=Brevibacillus daliensis TaxID=2892995 RepID=UPI001E5D0846|nr:YheC/YheD family protein [Brevibacillus daliensis]
MLFVRTNVREDSHRPPSQISIPKHIIAGLSIPVNQTVTVQMGQAKSMATITPSRQGESIYMHSSLLKSLHIPAGTRFLLGYNQIAETLYLGPLLGVLLTRIQRDEHLSPFGSLQSFMNELSYTYNQKGGQLFVFCAEDLHRTRKTISGFVQIENEWHSVSMPLPDCIYNRCASRKSEKNSATLELMEICEKSGIPVFNHRFVNKWQVHEALHNDSDSRKYLPETILYRKECPLFDMLTSHSFLYFKPTHGSMGRGIVRLRKNLGSYTVEYLHKNKLVTRTHNSLPSLQKFLNKRSKNKSYVLQQGIQLIGINSNPTDFRVLAQKNKNGKWAVTSTIARTGENHLVSNVARGGSMLSPKTVLNEYGPWRGNHPPSVSALKQVALQIAESLESKLVGHYAEFGIDLGIDDTGHIWLLEVNSKPSKSYTSLPGINRADILDQRARPSVLRLIEYTAFLSGYQTLLPVKKQPKKRKTMHRIDNDTVISGDKG